MVTLPAPGPAEVNAMVAAIADDLIELRRAFCAYPELSGEESRTAKRIAAYLAELGIETTSQVGGYGVVGVLHGVDDGPVVGCRADMDALPIQDTLDQPYRSLVLGVKHACGHDLHMAIALGTARILKQLQRHWAGSVVFLFQPAEESLDGALAMLRAGVLELYPIEALLALHAFPLPVGTIGLNAGPCLAGMEEFRVRFYAPEGDRDSLVRQSIAELEALSTAHAPENAEAFEALFQHMEVDLTLRQTTFFSCWPQTVASMPRHDLLGLVSMADFDLRPAVHAQISAVLDRIVAAHGASYDLAYTFANPPLHNDGDLVEAVRPALVATVGDANMRDFLAPYPFAHEDFAHFAAHVPAALFWLGTANPASGIESRLHSADYDVDEDALSIGTQAMITALLQLLDPEGPLARRTRRQHPDRDVTPGEL
jgi:metal-dependent amidase/aminoacylase/carboxypeptidase family protein